jgi:hypothetical protein
LFLTGIGANGIGEESNVPSMDANIREALVACHCASCFSILFLARRARSRDSSTISIPLTGEGERHRYLIDPTESATPGESSTSPSSSSSSDAWSNQKRLPPSNPDAFSLAGDGVA